MIKIYTVATTQANYRTLQAKGEDWIALTNLLRNQDKTYLLGLLVDQLPPTFSTEDTIRTTFELKYIRQLLDVAGLSS